MSGTGAPRRPSITTVQVGLGWNPARAGGLNRLFHELIRRLPGEGVTVHGLVAGGPEVAVESGGAVHAFSSPNAPMWSRVLAARRAVRVLVAAHPDAVLVSHFAPYGFSLLGAARRHPLVVYFHGPWSAESRAEGRGRISTMIRRAIERRVYRRARMCIVLSREFGKILQRDFGVPAGRITVIPGGVDTARFAGLPPRSEARRVLGWDVGAKTVLVVRRLIRRTGVDRLIDAVPALSARLPGIRILVAGKGPESAAYEARIRALNVGAHIKLLGFLPEASLPLAYRAADLTVVPSVALEGFGLVVPESLAAGTPVLVTPVGGLPETVEELSSDLVLHDTTPAAIAEGIIEAFDGRRALPDATRCAAFAGERYDWSVVARQVAVSLAGVV